MTKTEVELYLESNFNLCPPINYLFKIFYTDRWLRIHSLPDSKRYANTDEEWEILFNTQNTILEDIFTAGDDVILFSGGYNSKDFFNNDNHLVDHVSLKAYNFIALDEIDLHAKSQDYCEVNTFYTPYFTTIHFKDSSYNDVLKSIADDEMRAFFINPKSNTIFAPYDGGIDIIYKDAEARDFYKVKYNHYTQQENYK
jgi:hypothetical protein